MKREEEQKEPEIVVPSDFKLGVERFCCPKCNSQAVGLDPRFIKNNLANSINDLNKLGVPDIRRKCEKLVLVCTNCDHRDLLPGFIPSDDIYTDNAGLINPTPSIPNHIYTNITPAPYRTPGFYGTKYKNTLNQSRKTI